MRSTARETSAALRNWLVFLLATVPAAGVVAAGNGPCFSVSVEQTVVLPDGATHDAEHLRICVTHPMSPVSAIHKVYVDRTHVAMLVSRVGVGEGAGDGRAVMMFHRDRRGRLHLYGFAAPERGRMTNYLLSGSGFAVNRTQRPTKTFAQYASDAGTVLIAARDSER